MNIDPVLLDDWHVVGYARDLQEEQPMQARLLQHDLVIWRVGHKIHAWLDYCPHRGAKLSLGHIEDEKIICPYHGWRFNETGQCVHYPAHPDVKPPSNVCATVFQAQERYGLIWVTLGNPKQDIPDFKFWDNPAYHKSNCGPYPAKGSCARLLENFIDPTHFPYVHPGLLGDPAHPEAEDWETKMTEEGIIAKNVAAWIPNPDSPEGGARIYNNYHILRPLTAMLVDASESQDYAVFFTVTPVDELYSIAWEVVAWHNKFEIEKTKWFEDMLLSQDVPIVESQLPLMLPLDLDAELHVPSDRNSIAYRKWIAKLGMKFGITQNTKSN